MTGYTGHYSPITCGHAEAVKSVFCDVYSSGRQQDAAVLMKLCCHSTCFGVMSFNGDYPVGFILLQQAVDTASVIELCVRKTARRQRIGRHLLEQGLRIAIKKGASSVLLEVEVTNKIAYQLYRSSGFELVGKRSNYYRRRAKATDALVLKRYLS